MNTEFHKAHNKALFLISRSQYYVNKDSNLDRAVNELLSKINAMEISSQSAEILSDADRIKELNKWIKNTSIIVQGINEISPLLDNLQSLHRQFDNAVVNFRAQFEKTKACVDIAETYSDSEIKEYQQLLRAKMKSMVSSIKDASFRDLSIDERTDFFVFRCDELVERTNYLEAKFREIEKAILLKKLDEENNIFGSLSKEIVKDIKTYTIKNIDINDLTTAFSNAFNEVENNPSDKNWQKLIAINQKMKEVKEIVSLCKKIDNQNTTFGSLQAKIVKNSKEYSIKNTEINDLTKQFALAYNEAIKNPSYERWQNLIIINKKVKKLAININNIANTYKKNIAECTDDFSEFINHYPKKNKLTPFFFQLVGRSLNDNPEKINDFLIQVDAFLRLNSRKIAPQELDFILAFIRNYHQSESLNKIVKFIDTFKFHNDYKKYLDKPDFIDATLTLLDYYNEFDRKTIDSSWLNNFISNSENILKALTILTENGVALNSEIINGLVINFDITKVIIQQNNFKNNEDNKSDITVKAFNTDKASFATFLIDFIKHSNKNSDLAKAMRLAGEIDSSFCHPWLVVYSQYHPILISILKHSDTIQDNIAILKVIFGDVQRFATWINDSGYLSSDNNLKKNAIENIHSHFRVDGVLNSESSLRAESLTCLNKMQENSVFRKELKIVAKRLEQLTGVGYLTDDNRDAFIQYRKKIIPLLLNTNKTTDERIKNCKELARHTFKHKDKIWRVLADFFQCLSFAFLIIMPIRWYYGKSVLFSQAPTRTQQNIHSQLTGSDPKDTLSP